MMIKSFGKDTPCVFLQQKVIFTSINVGSMIDRLIKINLALGGFGTLNLSLWPFPTNIDDDAAFLLPGFPFVGDLHETTDDLERIRLYYDDSKVT